jgi:hypothetical protein
VTLGHATKASSPFLRPATGAPCFTDFARCIHATTFSPREEEDEDVIAP